MTATDHARGVDLAVKYLGFQVTSATTAADDARRHLTNALADGRAPRHLIRDMIQHDAKAALWERIAKNRRPADSPDDEDPIAAVRAAHTRLTENLINGYLTTRCTDLLDQADAHADHDAAVHVLRELAVIIAMADQPTAQAA
ncbi:hypothetical protein [Streptacidiphilus cavernicola]|uniref:Uncharacterized protein n=1 Tax=Streptacidiphilus cavernicola TaxID=3342716 RepID=A0ABV6VYA9_9ACTN